MVIKAISHSHFKFISSKHFIISCLLSVFMIEGAVKHEVWKSRISDMVMP